MRMFMSSYENDKRIRRRIKQQFVVGVRTMRGLNVAYTIDISRGGVKVGSPLVLFPLGEQVELLIDKQGEKYPFSGRVVREDGNYYINRIKRSVNTFFIRIDDERFSKFVIDNCFI
jgi:PilZ domain